MPFEHEILQLGITKKKKTKEILNSKSEQGWELISIVPDIGINQQGIIETKMLAVLKRDTHSTAKVDT